MDEATVVVALDFGTTFSGFAYSHKSDPDRVLSHYDWPCQARAGARPYCKTQTSLFYAPNVNGTLQLKEWGWSALLGFSQAVKNRKVTGKRGDSLNVTALANRINAVSMGIAHPSRSTGEFNGSAHLLPQIVNHVVELNSGDQNMSSTVLYFATNFKLYLASDFSNQSVTNSKLPGDLTVERLVVDYLRCMSNFIMDQLKTRYGRHLTKNRVQWCITVPAIWTEQAKQFMKVCAEKAGLVKGAQCSTDDASPHPVVIVLEPEAASVYCQQRIKDLQLLKGDKILIADVGGGTIDIVVHSKASDDPQSIEVNEESMSYGALGGGTFVDKYFVEYISQRIGCFREFCAENPSTALDMFSWWEGIKTGFDGSGYSAVKEISRKLSDAWEAHDRRLGKPLRDDYTELRLLDSDIRNIFDPEVNKVLDLIEERIGRSQVLQVVGGFAASAYLQKAIRERFQQKVKEIIIPPDPGSAVCQGAVRFGMQENILLSRIARKTYGIAANGLAKPGDPGGYLYVNEVGEKRCMNVFDCFVRKGERIPVNDFIRRSYIPFHTKDVLMKIDMFSSTKVDPRHTTEEEAALEGSFTVDISEGMKLGKARNVEVRMYFGKSSIEVSAIRENFGTRQVQERMLPVTFQS